MLTIHLGQDETDCFAAWVSSKEAGLTPSDVVDQKGSPYNQYFSILFYCIAWEYSGFYK